jgi:hypothetical protein
MDEEERQRQFDFILNQQAKFAADIQKLQESQAKLMESQAETLQIVTRLASVTVEGFTQINATLDTLIDAQTRTEERLTKLVEAQIHLAEAQAHTEQRLDALIDIVREWRNEKP